MIQVDFEGRLSKKDIKDYVLNNDVSGLTKKRDYWEGQNISIINKVNKNNAKSPKVKPNNLVIEPYYRTLSRAMVGYMFSQPVEQVTLENQSYLELLKHIWKLDNADNKNTQIGTDTTVFGVAYELHYQKVVNGKFQNPSFVKVKPEQCIPIYDLAIEPNLAAFIRYYKYNDFIYVDVYYSDVIEYYKIKDVNSNIAIKSNSTKTIEQRKATEPHLYKEVPWIVYENNEDKQGDVEPAMLLIDMLDNLDTSDANELDRFAELYLILTGAKVTKKTLQEAKESRAITLPQGATAAYLEKNINGNYLQGLKEHVIQAIHKHTGIIDLTNPEGFGNDTSGTALKYRLHNMEMIADEKESYFKDGLKKRNRLLTNILSLPGVAKVGKVGDPAEVRFQFTRNIPNNLIESYTIAEKQQLLGVSQQTIFELLPDIDADTEKKRIAEQEAEETEIIAQQNEIKIDVGEELEDR